MGLCISLSPNSMILFFIITSIGFGLYGFNVYQAITGWQEIKKQQILFNYELARTRAILREHLPPVDKPQEIGCGKTPLTLGRKSV